MIRFLALFASGLVLLGCEMTSSQRYELASTSYTTAVAIVMSASLAGHVSDAQMRDFNVIREEVSELLVEWGEALERGEEFDDAQQLQLVLNKLLTVQIRLGEPDDGNSGSSSLDSGPRQDPDWPYYVDHKGYLRAA